MTTKRQAKMRYIDFHDDHGLWRVRPIVNGKRLSSVYFQKDDLDGAIEYRDRILHESHRQTPTTPGAETFEQLTERWLKIRRDQVRNGHRAVNTIRDNERLVRLHIAGSALGRTRLRDVSVDVIEDYLVDQSEAGGSASHRRRLLIVLRQICALGVSRDRLVRNFAKEVAAPRAPKTRPDAWTEAEARSFLTSSIESPLSTLWYFLLHTGARTGEACGLRWEDVRLDTTPAEVSFVQQRLRNKPGEPMFGPLKTERSERTIPIDTVLVAKLVEQREATRDLRAVSGWDLVFLSQTGTPLETTNVARRWRVDVKKSGVRYLKPHGARSTHATITVARGSRLEEVSARLGHREASFTATVYYKSRGSAAMMPALHIAEALAEPEEDVRLGSVLGSTVETNP